jgi:hypothetical protein
MVTVAPHVLLLIYRGLLLVTLVFAALFGRQCLTAWQARPFAVTVAQRSVKLVTREVGAPGSERKQLQVFAQTTLTLQGPDRRYELSEERPVDPGAFVEYPFLRVYEPGTAVRALADPANPARITLRTESAWLGAAALGAAVWLFGTFAWVVHPLAKGEPQRWLALKVAMLLTPMVAGVVLGIWTAPGRGRAPDSARQTVAGTPKQIRAADALAELRAQGVTVDERVEQWLGPQVSFVEYVVNGRTWRSGGRCAAAQCEGRVDPRQPQDVQWAGDR